MDKRIYKSALLVLLSLLVAGCGKSQSGSGDSNANEPQKQGEDSDSGSQSNEVTSDEKHDPPMVVIETSMGDITVELSPEQTPLTVENFLEYVDSEFYDSTIFHQVLPGYAILGGTFTSDLGEKRARSPIHNEAAKGLKNTRGTIAMARIPETINSATSQFFINIVDNPSLDHTDEDSDSYGYCAFGKVVKGMDVVDKISKVPAEDTDEFEGKPVETVLIKQVRRVR